MESGKPVGNTNPRLEFTKAMFRKYYSKANVQPPGKLINREFGVITERGGMWRHLGFGTPDELQNFLKKQAPIHAYHSSAYYTKPNARTMDEKTWLGADLIFDLDADHIQGSENMTIEMMFEKVKVQFKKLVHSYLLDDFGFDENDVKIVFSGGRGYHAHVSNEKVLRLNSHERREIVDYITKPSTNIDTLVRKVIFSNERFKDHDNKKYIYRLYPRDTPGWRGKVTASVLDFIDRTEKMPKENVIDELESHRGIGDTLALKIYNSMYLGKPGDRGIDKMRSDLNLEPFGEDSVRNSFINHIVKEMTVDLGGETDEPVTSDIKRLIRLPGSVHGKTGLVVRTMTVEELNGFLPLRDSVWPGFEKSTVKLMGLEDYEVKLKNTVFKVKKDTETEVPEYAALFLLGQKKCDIRI
ncbi:MAG: DNA primase catalytic subunit PriS [Candidatus Thermoplasmatota archaeon]|nr:DNA primase catalytic subunit PriS [Candidatus Thermoplasmatota archaeon]MBU4072259.1 DNA primase catalytic subunit PriS [Candidatus Thermoplasmatota archaeon]MBU4144960.1 DNA primase catalytic subunit PriS [Candidatus Thermoplasmatota archaeon]MBU4592052.1 DNA primase catalytic subunit PriS [Candidatus Thermoplasmatota archaeon]